MTDVRLQLLGLSRLHVIWLVPLNKSSLDRWLETALNYLHIRLPFEGTNQTGMQFGVVFCPLEHILQSRLTVEGGRGADLRVLTLGKLPLHELHHLRPVRLVQALVPLLTEHELRQEHSMRELVLFESLGQSLVLLHLAVQHEGYLVELKQRHHLVKTTYLLLVRLILLLELIDFIAQRVVLLFLLQTALLGRLSVLNKSITKM